MTYISIDTEGKPHFCDTCDYGPLGLNNCSQASERYKYIEEGYCPWAAIGGVETKNYTHSIKFTLLEKNVSRSDLGKIEQLIIESREKGFSNHKKPKIPIIKQLKERKQEANL